MGRSPPRKRRKTQRPARAPDARPSPGRAPPSCRIVAVGGSAGGLEAITALLHGLPESPGIALIFIQHLTPNVESSLPSILAKATSLAVVAAEDGDLLQPNRLYVA